DLLEGRAPAIAQRPLHPERRLDEPHHPRPATLRTAPNQTRLPLPLHLPPDARLKPSRAPNDLPYLTHPIYETYPTYQNPSAPDARLKPSRSKRPALPDPPDLRDLPDLSAPICPTARPQPS